MARYELIHLFALLLFIDTEFSQIFSLVTFGTLAAPVLGGLLYTKTGYVGVFGVCLALIAIDIAIRLLMIEKKTAARYYSSKQDTQSALHETTPLLEVANKTVKDDDLHLYKLPTPSIWLTRKMPILCTLRSPALLTSLFIGFVQSFILGCFDATIPLIAIEYYSFDSLHSGLLSLALGLPSLILGPLFGWIVDRYGTRVVAVLGYGYLVPIHVMLRLPHPGGADQIRVFALLLVGVSVGLSAVDAPSLVEAGLVLEKYHKANMDFFGKTGPYAQLYGMNSMVFSLGFAVGPVFAGGVKDLWSYGNMNAIVAGICSVSAIVSWLYLGTAPRGKKDVDDEVECRDSLDV